MADVINYQRFWQRRDTAANWTAANPTLASGEVALETDTRKFKIGDGSTAWNSLNYYCAVPLADPGQDAIVFWDDSVGAWSHLTLGTGLSIAGTVISSSGGGGSGAMTLIGTATVAGSATTWLPTCRTCCATSSGRSTITTRKTTGLRSPSGCAG